LLDILATARATCARSNARSFSIAFGPESARRRDPDRLVRLEIVSGTSLLRALALEAAGWAGSPRGASVAHRLGSTARTILEDALEVSNGGAGVRAFPEPSESEVEYGWFAAASWRRDAAKIREPLIARALDALTDLREIDLDAYVRCAPGAARHAAALARIAAPPVCESVARFFETAATSPAWSKSRLGTVPVPVPVPVPEPRTTAEENVETVSVVDPGLETRAAVLRSLATDDDVGS
jgi:hypothetical protein